ncbi:MAG: tyrosine-type recombinase/integrase [Candidatus Acidiferrales bacterium]
MARKLPAPGRALRPLAHHLWRLLSYRLLHDRLTEGCAIASRHTHGTLLYEQGTPLRVAQAQLGHTHMTTTLEVYTHASAAAQRQAVDQLESQLFPNLAKLNLGRISK